MNFNKRPKFNFNAKKYLNTNYIKDNKAVISMTVDSQDMFYDELDADKMTLSSSITDFIDKRIYFIPYKYEIVIKLHCKNITLEEKEKITNMIRVHYGLAANELGNQLRLNNLKSLTLFIIGLMFLALSSISSNYGFIVEQVLSIAGWVAIWETVSSVLFGAIRLKLDMYDATNIHNAEVIFID